MYDNFIDVLLYVLSEEWFYIALLVLVLTVVLVANYHLDDNDLKLEAMEAERSERLRARLAESGDEEAILTQFFDTEDLPKERMDRLMKPSTPTDGSFNKLLNDYRLSAHLDVDTGKLVFTDHKHFGLKRRTYDVPLEQVMWLDEPTLRKVIARIRYNLNRRAVYQGLVAKHPRKVAV